MDLLYFGRIHKIKKLKVNSLDSYKKSFFAARTGSVDYYFVLEQEASSVWKLPWRNWLARSAVNRKVSGSSPPGSDS